SSHLRLHSCITFLSFLMAYYEDRRYARDRRPASGYAADYYDDHPRGYSRYERETYPRATNDSVEEIQREYPPGSDYVYERGYDSRRSRRPVYENIRRSSSVSGYDPYYSRPRQSRNYDDRRPRRSRYDSASSTSPSPSRNRRRKSLGETALGAFGLGAAASSSRRSDRDRDPRGRRRSSSRHGGRSSYSSSRSRSRSRDRGARSGRNRQRSEQRMQQAARAALTAGAVEAFRSRKEPGAWTGDKGKRILTAAVTAAGTDGLVDKDPKKHGTRHVIESTLAGLATSHFVNGGRSQSRGRGSNGRSRSSGGALKDLAATGALAAAGKEIFDRVSRSRSRPRGRGSDDSDDDRRGSKKRSKSVSDYINKGMAALGIGEEGKERERSRDRGDRDYDRRGERRSRRDPRYDEYSDSDAESDYRSRASRDRRGKGSRDVGSYRSVNGRNSNPQAPTSAPRGAYGTRARSADEGCDCSESDSDLGDSSDEKKKSKKLKRDMLLTSGLATVATIHAAHGVYGGVQKRKVRMKELEEGKITAEEARKRRMKANTMDAFAVGLAALGIKGAYGEWKEVNEKRKENSHFKHECAERAVKREQRRSRSQGHGPGRNRWPDEIEYPDSPAHNGVSYHDGNPYGATSDAPQIAY
ncbi:uncharacterized protein N7443_009841, partial [Penicillium atrosanguineum]